MVKNDYFAQKLDEVETEVVNKFRNVTVLYSLESLSQGKLKDILLQRRLLVLESFERFYNHAICNMMYEKAKEMGRKIVLDEYPLVGPTHREDAIYDMMLSGIERVDILCSKYTLCTQETMEQLVAMVRYSKEDAEEQALFDVQVVSALRMYEILAGEETDIIFQVLKRSYGLTEENSHYFWPHVVHDKKRGSLGMVGDTHADSLGMVLLELVDTEQKQEKSAQTLRKMGDVRMDFYAQFLETA